MERLRLLLIEDSDDDALIIDRALRRAGFDPSCKRVDTPAALQAAIRDPHGYDVILCDSCGPRFELRSILPVVHAACPITPILIVSGRRQCELDDVIGRDEVAGFLSKDHLQDISAVIAFLRSGPRQPDLHA